MNRFWSDFYSVPDGWHNSDQAYRDELANRCGRSLAVAQARPGGSGSPVRPASSSGGESDSEPIVVTGPDRPPGLPADAVPKLRSFWR